MLHIPGTQGWLSLGFRRGVASSTMKHSIRSQLLTPLLVALVAAVAIVAGCSAWWNLSRQMARLRAGQDDVVGVLERASFPLTDPILEQMARLSGQQFVVWDTRVFEIVASSFPEPPAGLEPRLANWTESEPAVIDTIDWQGDSYVVRSARLRSQPWQRMFVLTSRRSLAEARWDAVWPPLAVGAGTLLVLTPWLWGLTRTWAQRLRRIQQAVARIAAGEPASPSADPDERDDELTALLADVHRLSERLTELQQELIQTERERLMAQLAAGFAHQFRNGVAGASLALQLHAGRCPSADDRSLAVARQQLTLLETEIRGMLSLARRVDSPREALAVPDLVREAVALVQPAAEHRGLELTCDVPDHGPTLLGSRDGVRAALLNLLLNGLDAAGSSGRIRVQAAADDDGWTLSVRDSGPGPSPDVAARMTEAFVTTKPEGIGLGLTVVAAVAHDHGGKLEWRRENGWTVVELWLPCHASRTV
jgi:signal transduction histidine kinase